MAEWLKLCNASYFRVPGNYLYLSVMQFTKLLLLFGFAIFFCPACHKESAKAASPPPPSSTKSISSFLLEKSNNPNTLDGDIAGFISGDTITFSIPAQSSLTQLIPTITITGKAIQPGSGSPRDFSNPMIYTVTAEDGSTQNYTVIASYRRTLYFTDADGHINARDGLNGRSYWSFKTDTRVLSAPTVGGGKVFFTGDDGFYAVNALTGALLKVSVPNTAYEDFPLSVPMLAGGIVYGGFLDGTIRAIDTSTGLVKWTFKTATPFYSSPTVYNNHVYVGIADSCLYAIDATTGALQWKFKGGGPFVNNPFVMNNVVFAGSFGYPHFYALNADNGVLQWDMGYYIDYTSVVGLNGTIYADVNEEQLVGINATTGSNLWFLRLTTGDNRGSLYLAGGLAFFGSQESVYAYSLNTPQSPLWIFPATTEFISSTVVCKGTVYAGETDKICGLSATDGSLKMTTNAYGPSSVCIVDESGVIYHPAESGEY
jgi:eukaryotic-like serine/threonine-protein kinase